MGTTITTYTIGFLGGGNMAKSLIGGLADKAIAAKSIYVYDRNPPKNQALCEQYQINGCADVSELIKQSDILVLAVKPQAMASTLQNIATDFQSKTPLLISVAAGINCASMARWLDTDCAIIRAMPNTPSMIGYGATGLYANPQTTEQQKQLASLLLNSVGSTVWVENENQIDAVTALSGSGPAYFMLFIQHLITSAEQAGLPSEQAKQLAIDTAIGASQLIKQSEEPIEQLIRNITSPKGTTEKALQTFEQAGFTSMINKAFNAAKQRSEELTQQLTGDK